MKCGGNLAFCLSAHPGPCNNMFLVRGFPFYFFFKSYCVLCLYVTFSLLMYLF